MTKFTPDQIATLEKGDIGQAQAILLEACRIGWAEVTMDADPVYLLKNFEEYRSLVANGLRYVLADCDMPPKRLEELLISVAVTCAPMYAKALVEMEAERKAAL